MIDKI